MEAIQKSKSNMEKDKVKLSEIIPRPQDFFTLLEPASETRKDSCKLQIDFKGYSDLFCTIMDLLKVAMLALDGIEMDDSGKAHTEKYVYTLLRITEKMIPLEEGDLLDILHKQYLEEKEG